MARYMEDLRFLLNALKMQIKTTKISPLSVSISKKTEDKCSAWMWRKMKLCTVGGNVAPLWKIVWRFLKNLKMELPYDPAKSPFLHINGN